MTSSFRIKTHHILSLALCLCISFWSQAHITTLHSPSTLANNTLELQDGVNHQYPEEDEVGSSLFMLLVLMVMLVCFGIGVTLTLLALLLIAGLLAFGVLSISLLVAWYQKSLTAGFKTFILTSFSTLGGLSAYIFTVILFEIMEWGNAYPLLVFTSIGGVIAGLLFGYLFIYSVRTIGRRLVKKDE